MCDAASEDRLILERYLLNGVFGSAFALFGLIANGLLATLFLTRSNYRHSPFFFLGFVALFDTLFDATFILLSSIPVNAEYFDNYVLFLRWLHYMPTLYLFSQIFKIASVFCLIMASIERYFMTKHWTFTGFERKTRWLSLLFVVGMAIIIKNITAINTYVWNQLGALIPNMLLLAAEHHFERAMVSFMCKICVVIDLLMLRSRILALCLSRFPSAARVTIFGNMSTTHSRKHNIACFRITLSSKEQHIRNQRLKLILSKVSVGERKECVGYIRFKIITRQSNAYHIDLFNTAAIFVPFFTLIFLNGGIVMMLRKQNVQQLRSLITELTMGTDVMKIRRRNLRSATNTLIVIISAYLISNLLNVFLTITEYLDEEFLHVQHPRFFQLAADFASVLAVVGNDIRCPAHFLSNSEIRQQFALMFFGEGEDKKITSAPRKSSERLENPWISLLLTVHDKDQPNSPLLAGRTYTKRHSTIAIC